MSCGAMARRLRKRLTSLFQLRREHADLVAALRLACEAYPPCDQCGALAAEWWRWTNEHREEGPDMTALCTDCAGALAVDSQPAEPAEHIAAIAKVRHLLTVKS